MTKTYLGTYREVMDRLAVQRPDVGLSKFSVVDEEGAFRLLRYQALTERKYRTPVLIVYAWINRPYVLDLQPEISVVQKYLRVGFDVYMIDWGYPTAADRFLDVDDYVDFLDKCVERVKAEEGAPTVNLQGYCLGGTLSAVYTTLRQGNVKNLVLQAAPIDFHTENPLASWARSLDPRKIEDAYRMMPGELLNTAFMLADPINQIMSKYEGFLGMMESDVSVSSFLRMDHWIFDSPRVPGAVFRQYITDWYHGNLLIKGEFRALGETVDLGRIEVPLLVLAAKHDHIVPPSSQKAVLDRVASQDKDVYEIAKGHIGITTSRDAHKEFWPRVLMWLEKRSDTMGEGHAEARSLARDKGRLLQSERGAPAGHQGGRDAFGAGPPGRQAGFQPS